MPLPEKYNDIKQKFNTIISVVNNIENPNTDELFENWYKNKQKYIEWFNGDLIHEFGEIELHVNQDKKEAIIENFLTQVSHILNIHEYGPFYQFIKANEDGFFKNLVSNEKITFGKDIKLGVRLSKAFKYFIEDKDTLTTIQQLASQYIQKDKIKGILCVSVHPFDFLSLSENTYNWRSCHALTGDYAAGNLSYMGDESTCVWYLKGEDTYTFPGDIPWNSKKWRMLSYFDPTWSYCFLGRQYPFTADEILKTINKYLPGTWDSFSNDQITRINGISLDGPYIALASGFNTYKLYELFDVIEDVKSRLHYNDVLYSNFYTPYYSSNLFIHTKFPKIKVGYDAKCINCGEGIIVSGERYMLCQDCINDGNIRTDLWECSCCGRMFDPEVDEYVTLANEDVVCSECVNNGEVEPCGSCGEWFYVSEMKWSEKYEQYFCIDDFNDILDEEIEYRKENHITEDY